MSSSVRALVMIGVINAVILAIALFLSQAATDSAAEAQTETADVAEVDDTEEAESDESSEETNEESGDRPRPALDRCSSLERIRHEVRVGAGVGKPWTIWKARLEISSAATFESPHPTMITL